MTDDVDGLAQEIADLQRRASLLQRSAWIGTALWIAFVIGYAIRSLWGVELRFLELNEFGDFIAGVSAPLAFLWLVVGYYQQQYELRQNTLALRGQLAELKQSVAVQSRAADEAQALNEIARKELEFGIAQARMTAEESRRQDQPKLRIAVNFQEVKNGRRVLTCRLQNYGSLCTDGRVTLALTHENNSNCEMSDREFEVLRPGGDVTFSILILPEFVGPIDVAVAYRDIAGNQARQEIRLDRQPQTGKYISRHHGLQL